MDFKTIQEWEAYMNRQASMARTSPKTVRYDRDKIFTDQFALENAKALEAMFDQHKPDYTEWKDPGTGKVVMVVPRDFFDISEELFKNLPDVEIE